MVVNGNGVKPRFDNYGSEFGLIHRELPKKCGMFDIDKMTATANINLSFSSQDELYFEYRTDFTKCTIDWKAIFEFKHHYSESVEKALRCDIGTATFAQLDLSRKISARFFIVVGTNGAQPMTFYEINSDGTHKVCGVLDYVDRSTDGKEAINKFWNDLGLL